jgi:hypothetical protein
MTLHEIWDQLKETSNSSQEEDRGESEESEEDHQN